MKPVEAAGYYTRRRHPSRFFTPGECLNRRWAVSSQLIRLLFDWPQLVGRIRVEFEERERGRTQEFALRWSSDGGRSYREVARQQYTFSPPATTREVEDYRVALEGVTALELVIVPDVSGGGARASLGHLRLA